MGLPDYINLPPHLRATTQDTLDLPAFGIGYNAGHRAATEALADDRALAAVMRRIILDQWHVGIDSEDMGVVLDWFGFLEPDEVAAFRRVRNDP